MDPVDGCSGPLCPRCPLRCTSPTQAATSSTEAQRRSTRRWRRGSAGFPRAQWLQAGSWLMLRRCGPGGQPDADRGRLRCSLTEGKERAKGRDGDARHGLGRSLAPPLPAADISFHTTQILARRVGHLRGRGNDLLGYPFVGKVGRPVPRPPPQCSVRWPRRLTSAGGCPVVGRTHGRGTDVTDPVQPDPPRPCGR